MDRRALADPHRERPSRPPSDRWCLGAAIPAGATGGTIYVQSMEGGAPVPITDPGQGNDADPVFSPDGSQIAFRRVTTDRGSVASARIYLVDVDGSGLTPLTDGASVDQDPIFSPDGTQIAFKNNRPDSAAPGTIRSGSSRPTGRSARMNSARAAVGVADGAPAWAPLTSQVRTDRLESAVATSFPR